MAVDQEKRLKEFKRQLNQANEEKVRLETRLDMAKKTRKDTVQKIKDKGLEPKQLKTVIADKEKELDTLYTELETYLPGADKDQDDEDFEMDDDD